MKRSSSLKFSQQLRVLLASSAVLMVTGCSSSSIKITTNPSGAEVFVKTVGQTERHSVGKTPLVSTKISELQKGQVGGAVLIELEKEGFQAATILIAESGNSAIEVTQELRPVSIDSAAIAKNAELNKGLDEMFEAQRLARLGRLDDSLKILDDVAKAHPQLSPVREMRAGIYYLKKDFAKSLDEYRNATLLNADNASAQRMIKRLEAQLGTTRPPGNTAAAAAPAQTAPGAPAAAAPAATK